jgi:hypothetical protein
LPEKGSSSLPKPEKQVGYEKSYEDERSWNGQEKVVLVDRSGMTREKQWRYNLPCQ